LCLIKLLFTRSRERLERPIRQATTNGKDDACYHLPSTNPAYPSTNPAYPATNPAYPATNPAYPAMSRDTMNSPVFAPVVQRQTHVYDGKQSKSVLLAATDNRIKTPKQINTTRNDIYSCKL